MIVEVQNMLTGKYNQMDLPVTEEQLRQWLIERKLIQNVMPHLTSTQREFLITGMNEEEQDRFYGQFKE